MVKRGRGELCVDRRKSHAVSARERFDLTPAFRHPFIEGEQASGETHSQIVVEPALQCSTLRFILGEEVDPLADLSDRNDAQVQ